MKIKLFIFKNFVVEIHTYMPFLFCISLLFYYGKFQTLSKSREYIINHSVTNYNTVSTISILPVLFKAIPWYQIIMYIILMYVSLAAKDFNNNLTKLMIT